MVGLAFRVVRRPVYVAGRYLKLLRGIAQVGWFCALYAACISLWYIHDVCVT